MLKELQVGGLSAGLTSRQPQVDLDEEWVQMAERDRWAQKEWDLQIKAGSAAKPIFHPHLQEPILGAPLQPLRLVNEVRMMQLDTLMQRTARPELLPAVPPREPAYMHLQTFSRLPFVLSFMHTLIKWGMMQPPRATAAEELACYVDCHTGCAHHFTGERRIWITEWAQLQATSISISTGSTVG